MLKYIIEKYGSFSDSWINSFETSKKSNEITISITCSNLLNGYKYETINLILKDIVFSNINKLHLKRNNGIKEGLLEMKGNLILLDLDPIDYFDYLKENSNSSFIVNCKKIDAVFVNYYNG